MWGVRWDVMEIAVWLVAGFFAVNALVLGTSVFLVTNGRHRARREIRQLEALWRMGSSTSERRRAGKLVALSAAAALAIAASALTLPQTARHVTSALRSVIAEEGASGLASAGVGPIGPEAHRTSVVELAEGPSNGPTGTDADVSVAGARGDQATTPGFVKARPRSSTVIRVSWADVPRATGYDVQRSVSGTAGWATVATTRDDVTAYTDAGLNPEATYFYRVLVLLEDGAAAPPSDVVSATTPVDPPAATVLQVTSMTETSIDLAWDDVADESSYQIERSDDGGTSWIPIGTTGQDVTTYTDEGLEPDTTYQYRVVATNEGGSSAPSNVVVETTKNGADADDGVEDVGGVDGGDTVVPDDETAVDGETGTSETAVDVVGSSPVAEPTAVD
jgi:fibronectin type 3 domain-containing protein